MRFDVSGGSYRSQMYLRCSCTCKLVSSRISHLCGHTVATETLLKRDDTTRQNDCVSGAALTTLRTEIDCRRSLILYLRLNESCTYGITHKVTERSKDPHCFCITLFWGSGQIFGPDRQHRRDTQAGNKISAFPSRGYIRLLLTSCLMTFNLCARHT